MIECKVPRGSCEKVGVRQIPVPWAENNPQLAALLEALAITRLKLAAISGVAELLRLSWDEAAGIQQHAVERGLKRRRNRALKSIGIDETPYQERHA